MRTATHKIRHLYHPRKHNSHYSLAKRLGLIKKIHLFSLAKKNPYTSLSAVIGLATACGALVWFLLKK